MAIIIIGCREFIYSDYANLLRLYLENFVENRKRGAILLQILRKQTCYYHKIYI